MAARIVRLADVKPGGHFLTVQKLGSGWAAVEMWLNDYDVPGEVFPEPWSTGLGRYATRAEAQREMRSWAESDELDIEEQSNLDA